MFVFLGFGEGVVILAIVSSGCNMGTGINLLLRGLAGVMVTVIATAASTTTAPPSGTTLPEGRDASAGCPRVVVGGCGKFEIGVVILQLVECFENMGVSLDR